MSFKYSDLKPAITSWCAAIALTAALPVSAQPSKAENRSENRSEKKSENKSPINLKSAEGEQVPALHLEQTHFYWGPTDVLISNSGIRLENKGAMKFILVSTAPKWQVTVYRKDDHTMISKNLTDFGASGMVAAFIVNKQSRKVEETKVTAVKYGDYKARRVRNGNFFIEYLPLDKYPTQIEEILYDFYRQPTNGGLPLLCAKPRKGLDWMTGLKNDDVKELLSTQKISTAVVSKSDFQPPAGLRKVASMQEVTMSDAKRAAAGEASELFDLK